MPAITMNFHEPAWPDLVGKKLHHLTDNANVEVTGLTGGMQSGKPAVAFRIDLDDGSVVLLETSLALFLTVADGLKARYGDPRT